MIASRSDDSSVKRYSTALVEVLLILAILAGATYFRFSGLYWGEYQFLHPDERFLIWVGTDINPVNSLSEYFDTAHSSLNPQNRGHGFYVYGTLPMFLARYVVEWQYGGSGWVEMTKVGRTLSALADLGTVLVVFLIGRRLYGRWVGLLAMAFSAAVPLQIQQAHFFTMDTFTTLFSTLAIYFAVLISTNRAKDSIEWPSVLFGIALGMAAASKINTAPVAAALPLAMLIFWLRQPPEQRDRYTYRLLGWLAAAAFISLVVFRLLQPYAFSGPGFLGLKPNPLWVQNIREQRAQASRDVDFPPAMQWARRSHLFSLQNMVIWGLGLPLGLLSWAGFLWAGWRMLTGWIKNHSRALDHLLLWSWTGVYFIWQSLQINPTMRYELPIYPTLVIFAGWAVVVLFGADRRRLNNVPGGAEVFDNSRAVQEGRPRRWVQVAAVMVAGSVLLTTYGYAYGFTQIYTRPITRIAATRWIYDNIPGPVNLPIQTEDGIANQMLPFPYTLRLTVDRPYIANFIPKQAGTLSEIYLPRVVDEAQSPDPVTLRAMIFSTDSPQEPLATATVNENFGPTEAANLAAANPISLNTDATADPSVDNLALTQGHEYRLALDHPLNLDPSKTYALTLQVQGTQAAGFTGEVVATLFPDETSNNATLDQTLTPTLDPALQQLSNLQFQLIPQTNGWLSMIHLKGVANADNAKHPDILSLSIQPADGAAGITTSMLSFQEVTPEGDVVFALMAPPPVLQGATYNVTLEMRPQGTALTFSAPGIANEGDWDDALPLRMDGYDAFGGYYPLDLNFNMYWDDNPVKLERFLRILDESDYIVISSNRQWGSLPRLPERFPMTTRYYRDLLGCPPEFAVDYCYRIAGPGTFQGRLGFDLVKTFTSDPSLGPIQLNDQFAEEAFTVYDHPKVLIFKKNANFDSSQVRSALASVDLSQVVRVPPLRAGSYPATLLLPSDRWAEQQAGGAWSRLFHTDALQNRFQFVGVVLWYLTIAVLGLMAYPLLRLALPGLDDRGYPLARITGMLLLSYTTWLAGSARVPVTRGTVALVFLALALFGGWLAYRQRDELRFELHTRRRYFLIVEGLFLAFFLAFLLVRIGNPDLWHPWKGGEKPMDFSYFNAVLKSTIFPPYDPWYAGGYLNYYYYGFVLVGMPVKLLGIIPEVAYNLILPTLFSLIAMGAFSAAWNLVKARPRPDPLPVINNTPQGKGQDEEDEADLVYPLPSVERRLERSPYIPAIAAALGAAVFGNLGTVRMIYQGFQRLAAPNGDITHAGLLQLWAWGISGFAKVVAGARLPYAIGDWYWNPSRAIPAPGEVEPITEFPYFTVLYADLHAHLIALPLTLLALGLVIGFVLGRGRWRSIGGAFAWFGLAGLAIGALRPTNTWDMPTYLALAVVAIVYTTLRYLNLPERMRRAVPVLEQIPPAARRLGFALIGAGVIVVLAFLLFRPYSEWYALAYTKVAFWHGQTTPAYSYLIHWGLFLFVIVSWLAWETRDWMATTPVSALRKLAPYRLPIQVIVVFLILAMFFLFGILKVYIAWLVAPLGVWATVLLLRPNQSDAKRIVLFLFGTGLMLTLVVELIVLVGDVGRMNTVFKFYLQVWVLFAVGAAATLGWLLPGLSEWQPSWRTAWQMALTVLLMGVLLFTFMATLAKVEDRMAENAPHTLDGLAYMPYSTYQDEWGVMDLSQDYDAIRWLQENVQGSPVIVEANLRNLYRWGSRITINTGLPGVVGWEWHEQQQRAVIPGMWVTERILEIDNFYNTVDLGGARDFLQKYNVRYIIVGQQERGHYPGPGLDKFAAANGALWREVFRDRDTVIYEVIDLTALKK